MLLSKNKMTTERVNIVSTMMNLAILTNGEVAYDAVNPTVKELLMVARKETPLEGPIGICGTKCDESCETCKTYMTLLTEHFQEQEQQQWEDEYRQQKERDELLAAQENDEEHYCAACGEECVSYTVHWEGVEETHWMCERCYYYGQEEWLEYGGGLEWNESGYFD